MYKNLVVGAGVSGATLAYLLASELDERVLVIDRKKHIAGNCYDYRDTNGILIHQYGSHIFHTSDEKIWHFLEQFTKFNNYRHEVVALVDGKEVPVPFNINSLYEVFSYDFAKKIEEKLLLSFDYGAKIPILKFKEQKDKDLIFLADYVYKNIFSLYTKKQWGLLPEALDNSVTARVPVYISKDNRYFQDKYQGIPIEGYTKLVNKMLEHPNIELRLNTDYKDMQGAFDRIFYTGAIDEFFNYEYGALPYRSVNFKFEEYNKMFYQSKAVVNYTTSENHTRIHEYKYYLNDETPNTVIAKEYSEEFKVDINERYYPIPQEANRILYEKYLQKAKEFKNVYFLGRLGDYRYYNMDKAIARAFDVFEEIKKSL